LCQDISIAGLKKGLAGERSGLFFEIARLMGELRPEFVFLENVPAITHNGLRDITSTMAGLRYDCRWGIISARDMGAPHKRERWFLLAHANRKRFLRLSKKSKKTQQTFAPSPDCSWWQAEPGICRMANELPIQVDRVKSLGNAVVPCQAEEAFKRLMGIR